MSYARRCRRSQIGLGDLSEPPANPLDAFSRQVARGLTECAQAGVSKRAVAEYLITQGVLKENQA